ncbi:MAG: tyrosine-type recombinase/integrase [Sporolactobacillus sp.]
MNADFYIENYMYFCKVKGMNQNTLRVYEQSIKLFFIYLKNEFNISEVEKVEKIHIQKYVQYLKERGKYSAVSNPESVKINHPEKRQDYKKKLSDRTIANYVTYIKIFFKYLFTEEEVLTKNPAKRIPRIKSVRKVKRLISDEDIKKVFSQFDVTTFHGYRNWIISELLFDSGIRIGEALNIKVENIDFRNKSILITNPKNKKQRYTFFSFDMSKDLKRWLQFWDRYTDSEFIFPTRNGKKLEIRNFEYALKKAGERVNVPIHPHLLRNNFAKRYLLAGGDLATLSRILGHSSVDITEKAYLDFSNEELGTRYQQFSPLKKLKNPKH